jgi:alpha-glucosidase
MLNDLQKQGFKVIVSQDPIISKRNKRQWQEAAGKNLFVMDSRTGKPYNMPWPWGGPGSLVDFTKDGASDYWGELQQKVVDQGVDGFWTDMGEPAWSNLDAPDRLNMQHAAGPHAEIHNVYGFTWDRVVTDQWRKRNGNRRIFQMTRSAFSGMQRFTFGWSGDSGCSDDIKDEWKRLAGQVRIGQSSGLGGLVFWSSDISGYCGEINDYKAFAPIYVRWMQFGMFNSLSRVHHNGNWAVEPWQFGKNVENMVREAVERRYRLFPYIYTYARKSYDTGLPLMRPLALEYPGDKTALDVDTEFIFGKEMLVAPVVSDTTIRKLYLPQGNWMDYNQPSRREKGGRWIEQKAPLSETPIWVKAGSIIPTMPVMQYIHQEADYPIILDVFPHLNHGQAKFELYEDDGLTYDYEKNKSSRTAFSVTTMKNGWQVEVGARKSVGYTPPSPRNFIFKIHIPKSKERLAVFEIKKGQKIAMSQQALTKILDYKGGVLGYAIHKAENILYIKIPDAGNHRIFKAEFE